jgi:hypothetical protein
MRHSILPLLLTALAFGSACAEEPAKSPAAELGQQGEPDANNGTPDQNPDEMPDATVRRQLAYDGQATVEVGFGARGVLGVWYAAADGSPVVDGTVSFEVQGGELELEARTTQTDSDGVAQISVLGGNQAGSFKVIASADHAEALAFTVRVSADGAASYVVQPVYTGAVRLDSLRVALVAGTECDALDPMYLPEAVTEQTFALNGAALDPVGFAGLENGTAYTVVAVAHIAPNVLAAFGCNDEQPVIVAGVSQQLEVHIDETVPGIAGDYAIESAFDLTDGMPEPWRGNVNFVGGVFSNPVRALVDVLFGDPNDDDDGFAGNFLSDTPAWRNLVTAALQDMLAMTEFGAQLETLFEPGGEAYQVLTAFTLRGQLVIAQEPNAQDELVGGNLHSYDTIVTTWEGEEIAIPLNEFGGMDVLSAEFGGGIVRGNDGLYLELNRHGFAFDYGTLALGLFERVVLPRVFGTNNIEGAVEALVINCDAFASEMFPGVTEFIERNLASVACDQAVAYVADEVRTRITGDGLAVPNVTLATFPVDGPQEACQLGEPMAYGADDALRRVSNMGRADARCAWDARFETDEEAVEVDGTFVSNRR